ncbi:MAG: hypothetical protein WA210_07975 [Burkholderiaceae bacterium]
MLSSLKRAVYPLSSALFANASLVEGTLKGGGRTKFRCLFVHHCSFNEHLRERSFEADMTVQRTWRIFIPSLLGLVRQSRVEFDACVAVLPSFYSFLFDSVCDFKGREEIRQVVDTSGSWEGVRQGLSKTKRQITNNFPEKFGLSSRMSKDIDEFDNFYHRMYLPHIQKRYGDLSQIDSYESMRKFFEKGVLLLITKGDRPVAGALSLIEGKSLVFRRTGVLDGDESHVKGGAQLALYYFQLKYAVDNNFDTFDTMKSAPFLNDGVFRHKSEWGARTVPDYEAEKAVYLFARGSAEKLAEFFNTNPIVIGAGAELSGVVGDPRANEGAPNSSDELLRRFHTIGLRELRVYTPAGLKTVAVTATAGALAKAAPAPRKPQVDNLRSARSQLSS